MASERDTYMDAIRTVAIVRVVAFHVFRFGWMTVVFPSMGVMFALGGSLMARSMSKSSRTAITSRLRRTLPSLWLLAILLVPLMVFPNPFDADPWRPALASLLWWVFPLGRPEGNESLGVAWQPLWYLRTYIWLVLLSPLLLWLFRKAPWPVLLSPFVALLVVRNPVEYFDDSPLPSGSLDLLVFAGCWMVGFASHEGMLARLRARTVAAIAAVFATSGAVSLFSVIDAPFVDLGDMPLANACWSTAFALVLLRFRPGAKLLTKAKAVHIWLRRISGRSLTIYLWHGLAVAIATVVLDRPFARNLVEASWTPSPAWWLFFGTAALTAVAVATAGRIERARSLRS